MKKILVMVLCVIMAVMPAVAEEYSNIKIEQIQLSAEELGFDGANGEEIIVYAGDGYYLLWREDLYGPYIFDPNTGWHLIDTSEIDDEWASSQMFNLMYAIDEMDTSDIVMQINAFDDLSAAYIQEIGVKGAVKYQQYIFVASGKFGGDDYWIDLKDYKVYVHENNWQMRKIITSCGYIWKRTEENKQVYEKIDIFSNILDTYDLQKMSVEELEFIFENEEETIIVYKKSDGGHYAAWMNNKKDIICENCLIPAGLGASEAYYSTNLDALIYSKREGLTGNILVVSYKDGAQKVFINNGVELIAKDYSEILFDEKGGFEKEDEKTYSIKLICLMEDDKSVIVCAAVDYNLYNREKFVESYILNIETMESVKIGNSDEISNLLEYAVGGRNDGDIIYGNGLAYKIME